MHLGNGEECRVKSAECRVKKDFRKRKSARGDLQHIANCRTGRRRDDSDFFGVFRKRLENTQNMKKPLTGERFFHIRLSALTLQNQGKVLFLR